MRRRQPEGPVYTKWERRGSAIAHGAALIIGAPLTIYILPLPFSLAPCPVVSYMIARSFRRRQLGWGAFQGMQASVMQLLIFLTALLASMITGAGPFLVNLLWTLTFLLFLYSLWGALDTAMGYDFRYILIGRWLDRVSQANLRRRERRRKLFRPMSEDNDESRPGSS